MYLKTSISTCNGNACEVFNDNHKIFFQLASIFALSHLWSLKFPLFTTYTYWPSKCQWRVKWKSQVFYILQPYLWHLWSLNISCLAVICAYEASSDSHKYFTFSSNIIFFKFMTTYAFFGWQTYFFANTCQSGKCHSQRVHLTTNFFLSHLWSLKYSSLHNIFFISKCQGTVTNNLHLTAILVILKLWSFKFSLFGSHICFCKCLWSFKEIYTNILHSCH